MGLPVEHDRILTTLLRTDIVDSTKTLERLGDQHWKQLLREHDRLTRMLVEQIGTTITGLSINVTARIMALAGASQILVSSATRGLADGGGLSFRDAGSHEMKGFERPFEGAELVG